MSFFDIFTPNTVNKVVDGIYNGTDMILYTDEEKAKAEQLKVDTKLKMLPLFEAFKLAQRYLAFAFTTNFLLSFWVGVGIFMFGSKEQLDGYLLLIATFQLGWIMLAIISFYFGGGFIESFKSRLENKVKV